MIQLIHKKRNDGDEDDDGGDDCDYEICNVYPFDDDDIYEILNRNNVCDGGENRRDGDTFCIPSLHYSEMRRV